MQCPPGPPRNSREASHSSQLPRTSGFGAPGLASIRNLQTSHHYHFHSHSIMPEHNPGPGPKGKNPDDSTLGGYINLHSRPPAFEGTDGHPYTVSIELEHTGNLRTPYSGYLVFPKWAESGVGIVGHVETPILAEARTGSQAIEILQLLTLQDVKRQLEKAIIRQQELRRGND